MKTPFESAMKAVEAGSLQTPEVTIGQGKVPYFAYQVSVHYFNLKLMSKGLQVRGVKLKDLKDYYGLKGRTAAECLPQMEAIRNMFIA
jgi:hypothetical protein